MRFWALDFETSGTDANRHAPVQLGLALMHGETVIDSTQWLIGPPKHWKTGKITREYDVCALQVSGIGWKQIQEAPSAKQVVDDVARFVARHRFATVVAFNAPFDLAFWSQLLFEAGGWGQEKGQWLTANSPLLGPWQCARLLARDRLVLARYDLDTVASHFGMSRETDRHGALEDAILAGRIFARLTATQQEVA